MNLISRYGDGEVLINGQRYTSPLLVAPGFLQSPWVNQVTELTDAALEPVWPLQPRVLLLGTTRPNGTAELAAARALRSGLAAKQIGLEAMDLGAACRTYNVLAQEDRPVAALLFP